MQADLAYNDMEYVSPENVKVTLKIIYLSQVPENMALLLAVKLQDYKAFFMINSFETKNSSSTYKYYHQMVK